MIENIDLSKYKRLFTIGCSFTEYMYPTWANILSKSMPNAEFYNLGLSGTNNPFIANRMAEGNVKFKFCETDLVVVMWTTTARECHYARGRWINPGNIFSQEEYNKEFVEKFADPNGYLIRDLATIELATSYANNLPCTYVGLLSTPIDFRYLGDYCPSYDDDLGNEVLDTYSELLSTFPKSMLELEMKSKWESGSTYRSDMFEGVREDYHPTCVRYCNYLIKLGFAITEDSINYAKASTEKLRGITHRNDFLTDFPECSHLNKIDGIW
jgi:hypothetical protein